MYYCSIEIVSLNDGEWLINVRDAGIHFWCICFRILKHKTALEPEFGWLEGSGSEPVLDGASTNTDLAWGVS